MCVRACVHAHVYSFTSLRCMCSKIVSCGMYLAIFGHNIRSSHVEFRVSMIELIYRPSSTTDLELGYSLSPLLQSVTLSGETLHVNINLTVIRVCGPRVDR